MDQPSQPMWNNRQEERNFHSHGRNFQEVMECELEWVTVVQVLGASMIYSAELTMS